MIRNARQLTMAGKLLFPVPDRGLAERLYRIRARTVIVWGEDDRMIPPVYGEAFRRGVAGTACGGSGPASPFGRTGKPADGRLRQDALF